MRGKSILTQFLLFLLFLSALRPTAFGKIIYVDDDGPADFDTIQAAIDDANNGDAVLVAPGTYTGDGNRDIEFKGKAITVKSEDGPETCIIDCNGTEQDPHRGFYFHNCEDVNSTLDGFTIIRGYTQEYGGAIFCDKSSPFILRCIISRNTAQGGGGIELMESNSHIQNCLITGNQTFQSNVTCDGGGIVCIGNVVLINCTICGNRVIYGSDGGVSIGGRQGDKVTIKNCIVWGNSASQTCEQISNPPPVAIMGSALLEIINCTIQSDTGSTCLVYYEGSWSTAEPCFANTGYWDTNETPDETDDDFWVDGDYHLKSQAGRYDPVSETWVIDDVTSPCIDTGDPNSTIDDEPFPNGGIINMGAYGGTAEASKSYMLAKTFYVDDDAVGLNDGTSWENAYTFLQDALTDAKTADKPVEIRVAQGTYKPNQGLLPIEPGGIGRGGVPYSPTYPADEGIDATFNLVNGVTIKGGFAGLTELDPNTRDVELYETILSGDLNGDDVDVNDPGDLFSEPTRFDNSYNVVSGSNTDETAVLDGLTITGGRIWVTSRGAVTGGAGMCIYTGSPTLINCTFTGNATRNVGGGLLVYNGNPTLISCTFTKNYASGGGGMCTSGNSSPTMMSCEFIDNFAQYEGGGMCNYASDPNLINCVFNFNYSNGPGAGMYNYGGNLVMTDCLFVENMGGSGGGVYSEDNSNLILENCIIWKNIATFGGGGICNSDANNILLTNCLLSQNSAEQAGGGLATSGNKTTLVNCIFSGNKVYGESASTSTGGGFHVFGDSVLKNCIFCGNWARQGCAIYKYSYSNLKLTNCILWDSGNEIYQTGVDLDITYSNIQGNWEGKGNIDVDPLFAEPGYWADVSDSNIVAEPNDPNAVWVEGDYHLKSQAGRWDPNSQSWVIDDVTSPCIDTGDPNSPIGDEPEPNGGIINMGAYGGTSQASKSYIEE